MQRAVFLLIAAVILACVSCTPEAYLTAPTDVTAEQKTIDGKPAVRVTWKPVFLAWYYLVYRSGQRDGVFEYTGVSNGKEWNGQVRSFYDDAHVESGRTYYYKVIAGTGQAGTNDSGFSDVSEGITIQ
jgi:hypothetical protein